MTSRKTIPPEESELAGDRPTVEPSFDPEAFARDSELRLRSIPPVTGEPAIDEAHRLFQQGEPEPALFLLARLLQVAPLHPEANALSNECRGALERECLSAIGSHSAILIVAASPDELKGFALDHVSGFLISLMDEATDVETLLDLCGLPRLLALRHLRGLMVRGIIVESRRKPRR